MEILTLKETIKRWLQEMNSSMDEAYEDMKIELDKVQQYADCATGCKKVAVGTVIMKEDKGQIHKVYGANKVLFNECKERGCHRIEKYGEDSKNHRNPEDCRAIHSEIDALCKCAKDGVSTKGAVAMVTRYPCEACARALIDAEIGIVIYGRKQEISEETKHLFETARIPVVWIKDWEYEDTER